MAEEARKSKSKKAVSIVKKAVVPKTSKPTAVKKTTAKKTKKSTKTKSSKKKVNNLTAISPILDDSGLDFPSIKNLNSNDSPVHPERVWPD